MCIFARETMIPNKPLRIAHSSRLAILASALLLSALTRTAVAEEAAQPGAPAAVSLVALHSDLKFSLVTAARKANDAATAAFEEQLRRISDGLSAASALLYSDVTSRIGRFDVFIADSPQASASSSATGRIALSRGLWDMQPTDDWLALVVAREMGHVIAGHHDNNSMASLVTSVLINLVLPGSGLIKTAISFAGSQVAAVAGRERQIGEADEIAFKLLEATGYTAKSLALNLALGPSDAQLGTSAWAEAFSTSSKVLIARVRGVPQAMPVAAVYAGGVVVPPLVASTDAHMSAAPIQPGSRIAPEAIVVRWRPSGMLGPLMLGGQALPFRRIE